MKRRHAALGTAVMALAALLFAGPVPSAGAQEDPSGPASLTLVSQDAWTPLGGTVTLALDIGGAPPDALVSLTLRDAITTRTLYDRIVGGGSLSCPPSCVLGHTEVPVRALPTDAQGRRLVSIPTQTPDVPRDTSQLGLRRPGIFPLEVELRSADEERLAGFTTPVVVAERAGSVAVAEPLAVVWVWPLVAAPARKPNGQVDPAVAADLAPDGRLGRQAGALTRANGVPLTLVPGPETLESWIELHRSDPTEYASPDPILLATGQHQVLETTYVPVNLPSLLEAGMEEAVTEQLVRGDAALPKAVLSSVDSRTALVRPVSEAVLRRLRTAGVDHVLLDGDALVASNDRYTPAQPFTIGVHLAFNPSTEPVTALGSDTFLEKLLANRDTPPALRAQQVLAGLSLVALEQPSIPRVVMLVNPDEFDAPSALLDAMFAGLRNSPYLSPVTATDAFARVPVEGSSGSPRQRELKAYTPPEPNVSNSAYVSARARLGAFASVAPAGDPDVARADQSLLASVTSAWKGPPGHTRARRSLAVVDTVINAFLGRIRVPDAQSITLTSRSGEIPLTFRNDNAEPVRVRIELASDKLLFPEGTVRDVELPPRSTTVRVAVEARTSGTFPLRLRVSAGGGALPISDRRYEVRSTFVSTVGIVLMAGAALFLAGWWAIDLRRRQRRSSDATTG